MLVTSKKPYLNALSEINILEEHFKNDFKLLQLTKFNSFNSLDIQECSKLICHLSFKDIGFDKKKIIISLFLLELLSSQKSCLIQSKTNNMFLKIRKGAPVGCKVTLRGSNMFEMLDSISMAFTRMPVRNFIQVPKKIQKTGSRFFCYQMNTLERFLHLSVLTIGEQNRKVDMCWVFSKHIWQESIFYLSLTKMPLNIRFKQKWNNKKSYLKPTLKISSDINNKKNLSTKVDFIENESLFFLNRIFHLLTTTKTSLLVNTQTSKKILSTNNKINESIVSEIKLPLRYVRLLSKFKGFPIKRNYISGNINLILLKDDISLIELKKIFDVCYKSKQILPICWFHDSNFYTFNWFYSKLNNLSSLGNFDDKMLIYLFLNFSVQNIMTSLNFIKKDDLYSKNK